MVGKEAAGDFAAKQQQQQQNFTLRPLDFTVVNGKKRNVTIETIDYN